MGTFIREDSKRTRRWHLQAMLVHDLLIRLCSHLPLLHFSPHILYLCLQPIQILTIPVFAPTCDPPPPPYTLLSIGWRRDIDSGVGHVCKDCYTHCKWWAARKRTKGMGDLFIYGVGSRLPTSQNLWSVIRTTKEPDMVQKSNRDEKIKCTRTTKPRV